MACLGPGGEAARALVETVRGHSTAALFRRLRRAGDASARDQLVARFLPLARGLARRYDRSGEPFDDLVQVASVGLLKAVDRFDERRGVSFTAYAVPTITGELKRHFRDNSWALHVPRGTRERALQVHAHIRDVLGRVGRSPRLEELADELSMSEQEVRDALGALRAFDALSLDGPAFGRDDGGSQSRWETVGSVDHGLELADSRVTLGAALDRLPIRERRVLRMRFVEDRTQSDIAAHIGVSQMQVSRILRRTLEQVRTILERTVPAA